jgi:hypothetical protein
LIIFKQLPVDSSSAAFLRLSPILPSILLEVNKKITNARIVTCLEIANKPIVYGDDARRCEQWILGQENACQITEH